MNEPGGLILPPKNGPSWMPDLFDPAKGNATAGDYAKRSTMLAEMFPSCSLAFGGAGGPDVAGITGKDMPAEYVTLKANGRPFWPRSGGEWLHNDFRQVAYSYQFQLFDAIIQSGSLNK